MPRSTSAPIGVHTPLPEVNIELKVLQLTREPTACFKCSVTPDRSEKTSSAETGLAPPAIVSTAGTEASAASEAWHRSSRVELFMSSSPSASVSEKEAIVREMELEATMSLTADKTAAPSVIVAPCAVRLMANAPPSAVAKACTSSGVFQCAAWYSRSTVHSSPDSMGSSLVPPIPAIHAQPSSASSDEAPVGK